MLKNNDLDHNDYGLEADRLSTTSDSRSINSESAKSESVDKEQLLREKSPFVRIRGLSSMASEYRSGDGVNPREEKRQRVRRQRSTKCDYSAERLASQILTSLSLSSLLTDLGLDDFAFVSVTPAQQSGCYLAEVRCRDASISFDLKEIERQLRLAKGRFRAEVSEFVHRRKVPDLQFHVLPSK